MNWVIARITELGFPKVGLLVARLRGKLGNEKTKKQTEEYIQKLSFHGRFEEIDRNHSVKDFQEAFHPTVRAVNGSFDFTVFGLCLSLGFELNLRFDNPRREEIYAG